MINRLMISVATAALIAGTGIAYAQGMDHEKGHEAPAAAPAVQHNPPPSNHAGVSENRPAPSGMKATETEPKAPAVGRDQRADEARPGQPSKAGSSEMRDTNADKATAAEGRENHSDSRVQDFRAQDNRTQDRDDPRDLKADGREDRNKAAPNDAHRSETIGQAGAGAKLSTEQRTRISSMIREQHVRPVDNIDFPVSVGTRVPRNVEFHPLPEEIVSFYPEWRGYEFILVRDEILVVDPTTFEIVAVLET